jgi:hypothetical protein
MGHTQPQLQNVIDSIGDYLNGDVSAAVVKVATEAAANAARAELDLARARYINQLTELGGDGVGPCLHVRLSARPGHHRRTDFLPTAGDDEPVSGPVSAAMAAEDEMSKAAEARAEVEADASADGGDEPAHDGTPMEPDGEAEGFGEDLRLVSRESGTSMQVVVGDVADVVMDGVEEGILPNATIEPEADEPEAETDETETDGDLQGDEAPEAEVFEAGEPEAPSIEAEPDDFEVDDIDIDGDSTPDSVEDRDIDSFDDDNVLWGR